MMQRRMWADTDWATNPGGMYVNAKRVHTSVPVLVTSLEGAPDFKPGDRVRNECGDVFLIDSVPFWSTSYGDWRVLVWGENAGVMTVRCCILTKLPREKTEAFPVGSLVRERGTHGSAYEVLTNPFRDEYMTSSAQDGPFIMGRRTHPTVYPDRVDRLRVARLERVEDPDHE